MHNCFPLALFSGSFIALNLISCRTLIFQTPLIYFAVIFLFRINYGHCFYLSFTASWLVLDTSFCILKNSTTTLTQVYTSLGTCTCHVTSIVSIINVNFIWTRVRWISLKFELSLWRFLPPLPHQYSQDYGGGGGGEEEDSKHSSQCPWDPVRR